MPFNDVSARDLQFLTPQWTAGKAIDTFAPCGPALVTLDEIEDIQALGVRTRLNGAVVQEGTTAEQIFPVAEAIAWLSRTMTLLPGDIIATGTPAGVGASKGLFLSRSKWTGWARWAITCAPSRCAASQLTDPPEAAARNTAARGSRRARSPRL